jgi:hypothetical protein
VDQAVRSRPTSTWHRDGSVQFTPNLGALAAYRYMDVDYEDGEGRNYFKYDMAISAPALGVVFTF